MGRNSFSLDHILSRCLFLSFCLGVRAKSRAFGLCIYLFLVLQIYLPVMIRSTLKLWLRLGEAPIKKQLLLLQSTAYHSGSIIPIYRHVLVAEVAEPVKSLLTALSCLALCSASQVDDNLQVFIFQNLRGPSLVNSLGLAIN